jgi:aryl-phospho-beta-D-glucosidase BglC (GH1 family)
MRGDWNNGPAQEYYFDDYKKAGFTCVRIPVRWDLHTEKTAPYKVDEAWMNRVEKAVGSLKIPPTIMTCTRDIAPHDMLLFKLSPVK